MKEERMTYEHNWDLNHTEFPNNIKKEIRQCSDSDRNAVLGEVRDHVGFYIDDSDIRILHYNTRGCRPASDAEISLWDYIKHFA